VTGAGWRPAWRHVGSIVGAAVALLALVWVLWRVDYQELEQVLAGAGIGFLLLLALAIAAEQLMRAWKWRQLLFPLRSIGTLRLFGAIMAGYLASTLIPLGISPLVRAWLIARSESLRMTTVLATVAVDRLVDGLVFTGFVVLALALAAFPDPSGDIRLGLSLGGAGSFVLFALLLWALARYKRGLEGRHRELRIAGLLDRLPAAWARVARSLGRSFAEGIAWPQEPWRRVAVVFASVAIKVIAISHFLWAGLAFDVVLRPSAYLFLVVFLGFLIVLTHLARIPGGFFLGAIFALERLGVAEAPALAMVLAVQLATLLTVGGIGAIALWRHGVGLDELRRAGAGAGGAR